MKSSGHRRDRGKVYICRERTKKPDVILGEEQEQEQEGYHLKKDVEEIRATMNHFSLFDKIFFNSGSSTSVVWTPSMSIEGMACSNEEFLPAMDHGRKQEKAARSLVS